jgi:diguanylate cyclase (GGDEF)-like protein/PAS domain S-box-containing protein
MNSLIAWLHWGVQSQPDSTLKRKILHTNIAAFVAILSLLFYQMVFFSINNGSVVRVAVEALPFEFLLSLIPFLNLKGKDNFARWSLAFCVIASLSFIVLTECGNYLNAQIYFLLFAIVPGLFFPRKQWRSIIFLFILNLMLYLFSQYSTIEPSAEILAMDISVVKFLRSSYSITAFLTLFSFVCLNEVISENNESRLEHALSILNTTFSESKQIAEDLRIREQQLSLLIESIPDSIQFKDGAGRWLVANDLCLNTFCLDKKVCLGLNNAEISQKYPELETAMASCDISDEEAWRSRAMHRTEERFVDHQKKVIDFDVIRVPLFDEQDNRQALVTVRRDTTEQKQIQQRLSMAIEVTQILFWELDLSDGQFIYDRSMLSRLGLEADDSFNTLQELLSRVHPDDQIFLQERITYATQHASSALNYEYRLSNKAGEYRWLQTKGRVIEWAADGSALSAVGTSINIDMRKLAEQIIIDNEERYRNLASMLRLMCDNVPDMIWAKDLNQHYIFANKAMCEQLLNAGNTEEPIGKSDMFFAQRERESHSGEADWHTFGELCQNTDVITLDRGRPSVFEESGNVKGRYLVLDVHKAPFYNESGKVIGTVGSARDITDRKHAEQHLNYIAHYDALTALPNRLLLSDRMRQAITLAQRHQHQLLAIAYLDLDGFKYVNDYYGHDVGDQLLTIIATRMRETLREGDTLARLGGDEFVAVLLDLPDMAASYPMLTRLLAAAAQPVTMDEYVLQVSASLGVTFYPQTHDVDADVDADQLLRQADQAMYQAKLAGKNRYHVFDTVRDRSVRGFHESLGQIGNALKEHQFVLHFQPEVNMRSGEIIGAEALIRWQHPERGLLLPAIFLPVIEEHPLAVDVGEWVIDSALTQLEQWDAAGLNIRVSVNVSAFQLQQANFVDRLRSMLNKHPQVAPARLVLEVLESSAIEDIIHVSHVINECRQFGVTFALDDFGTGYSSLTYLRRLPVEIIKIDQSFVQDMLRDAEDMAIIEGVLSLANAFGRIVIAEGVESVEQGATLLQLGCDIAQGYAIARPMSGAELPGWTADWHKEPSWGRIRSVSFIDERNGNVDRS